MYRLGPGGASAGSAGGAPEDSEHMNAADDDEEDEEGEEEEGEGEEEESSIPIFSDYEDPNVMRKIRFVCVYFSANYFPLFQASSISSSSL